MQSRLDRKGPCGRASAAAGLAVALLLTGCSGASLGVGAPSPSAAAPQGAAAPPQPSASSLSEKIETFFGASKPPPPGAAAQQQPQIDCPLIDIRQGASTLTVPPPPPDGSNEAMALKYQGTFVRAARDCKLVAGQVVMRLGVEGRLILGPAGGPGQVEVPLRIAVVDNPVSNTKVILTKLVRIPVAIGPGEGSKSFVHVEDNLSFPMPPGSELERYLVYIGFDPIGAAEEDRARHAPPPRAKPKRHVNPNVPSG